MLQTKFIFIVCFLCGYKYSEPSRKFNHYVFTPSYFPFFFEIISLLASSPLTLLSGSSFSFPEHHSISGLWVFLRAHPLGWKFLPFPVCLINFYSAFISQFRCQEIYCDLPVSHCMYSVYTVLSWDTFIQIKLLTYLFVKWLSPVPWVGILFTDTTSTPNTMADR